MDIAIASDRKNKNSDIWTFPYHPTIESNQNEEDDEGVDVNVEEEKEENVNVDIDNEDDFFIKEHVSSPTSSLQLETIIETNDNHLVNEISQVNLQTLSSLNTFKKTSSEYSNKNELMFSSEKQGGKPSIQEEKVSISSPNNIIPQHQQSMKKVKSLSSISDRERLKLLKDEFPELLNGFHMVKPQRSDDPMSRRRRKKYSSTSRKNIHSRATHLNGDNNAHSGKVIKNKNITKINNNDKWKKNDTNVRRESQTPQVRQKIAYDKMVYLSTIKKSKHISTSQFVKEMELKYKSINSDSDSESDSDIDVTTDDKSSNKDTRNIEDIDSNLNSNSNSNQEHGQFQEEYEKELFEDDEKRGGKFLGNFPIESKVLFGKHTHASYETEQVLNIKRKPLVNRDNEEQEEEEVVVDFPISQSSYRNKLLSKSLKSPIYKEIEKKKKLSLSNKNEAFENIKDVISTSSPDSPFEEIYNDEEVNVEEFLNIDNNHQSKAKANNFIKTSMENNLDDMMEECCQIDNEMTSFDPCMTQASAPSLPPQSIKEVKAKKEEEEEEEIKIISARRPSSSPPPLVVVIRPSSSSSNRAKALKSINNSLRIRPMSAPNKSSRSKNNEKMKSFSKTISLNNDDTINNNTIDGFDKDLVDNDTTVNIEVESVITSHTGSSPSVRIFPTTPSRSTTPQSNTMLLHPTSPLKTSNRINNKLSSPLPINEQYSYSWGQPNEVENGLKPIKPKKNRIKTKKKSKKETHSK